MRKTLHRHETKRKHYIYINKQEGIKRNTHTHTHTHTLRIRNTYMYFSKQDTSRVHYIYIYIYIGKEIRKHTQQENITYDTR